MKKFLIPIIVAIFGIFAGSYSASAQSYLVQKAYEVLSEEHDFAKALELLEEQLETTPKNAEALYFRGMILSNTGEYGKALSDFNQAIKYNKPKKTDIYNSTLHWAKAQIYSKIEDYSASASEYKTAITLARKEGRADIQDIYFDLGQVFFDMESYDEADAVYNQMIRADETNNAARIGLARNMIAREKYQDAIDILDKAAKYSEDYSEIYHYRLKAYDKLGQTDKAIDDALSYYHYDDDPDIDLVSNLILKHKNYGIVRAKAKAKGSEEPLAWIALMINVYEGSYEFDKAIAEYDKLEREYGKDAVINQHRASCYNSLGLTDIALSEVDKAIEADDDSMARLIKADILRYAGRYDESLAELEIVIDRIPDNGYGYYIMGFTYELAGKMDKAIESYNKGIDIDQSLPYMYYRRAKCYLEQGDKAKAEADFDLVIEKDTTAYSPSSRQYALHFLGRDDESLAWVDKMFENEPYNDIVNYYDKACLCSMMGRADEAMKAFAKCLELGYCDFIYIRMDKDLDPIRDRADFKELVSKYEAKLADRIAGLNVKYEENNQTSITEVPITRHAGGTFNVECSVNGLTLSMLFDTGASDVSISKVEADFMLKNNYLSRDDIKGKRYYQVADGGLSEGTVITLKEVKIGDAVLRNVDASVVKSQNAPLLLGESVLQKFGTFTIDNINSKLIIKH